MIVRYADDFVIGFREESDARNCLAALGERFAKFGLELHPEKTRLIQFGRYAEARRARGGQGPPETFDFLGFTHISGKTRRGDFTIHRRTSRKKFQAKLAVALDNDVVEGAGEVHARFASHRGTLQEPTRINQYSCLTPFFLTRIVLSGKGRLHIRKS
jgi:hypothetical protein